MRGLLNSGYSREEFDIYPEDLPMAIAQGLQRLLGYIAVRHRERGILKQYITGNLSHWVADFTDDLRAGVFKVR